MWVQVSEAQGWNSYLSSGGGERSFRQIDRPNFRQIDPPPLPLVRMSRGKAKMICVRFDVSSPNVLFEPQRRAERNPCSP